MTRRALTIPAYILLATTVVALLPLLLLATGVGDLWLRRRWFLSRCLLALTLYLGCEAAGIIGSGLLWLSHGRWRGGDATRYQDANYRLQSLWARGLFHGARRIFGFRVTVTGDEAIPPGPILLLVRHASTIDTLLAAVFVTARHGIRLRYVMKRELLWDPCLDIVGHRVPNVFIDRGAADSEREIASIGALASDLGPRDGVLLYPEGTRFTAEKRERIIARLRQNGEHERAARCENLRHVLPPRRGGVQALLDANPRADIVFLAHVGFEAVGSLNDLWNGALIGGEIRLHFWRVPADEVPASESGRMDWLTHQWLDVDRWIDAQLAESPTRAAAGARRYP